MRAHVYPLDAVRFFAALSVMFFHLSFYSWASKNSVVGHMLNHATAYPTATPFTSWGWVGVEIFFVISGFVIANSANNVSPIAFAKSRVLRLYPAGRGERYLWLGLETAARCEAIRQLTWDRVDWQTRTIDFNVPGRKRTKKRRAVVPISKALEAPLRRMQVEALDPKTGHVLDTSAPVRKLIDRIAKNAGVPGLGPNVLRHTAATYMARSGVPLWIIAKILGNSVAMVERVYAKHDPNDLREGIEKISGGAAERHFTASSGEL